LGGAQVGYLKASIYQEVIFWANTLAAIFIYMAVRGLLRDSHTSAQLGAMALVAGLTLLARISTGIGLCTALGMLLATRFSIRRGRYGPPPPWRSAHGSGRRCDRAACCCQPQS